MGAVAIAAGVAVLAASARVDSRSVAETALTDRLKCQVIGLGFLFLFFLEFRAPAVHVIPLLTGGSARISSGVPFFLIVDAAHAVDHVPTPQV